MMSIADAVRREAAIHTEGPAKRRATVCEQAAVRISIRNLTTFPFVQKAVTVGRLQLHDRYFDLDGGELLGRDSHSGRFSRLAPPGPA